MLILEKYLIFPKLPSLIIFSISFELNILNKSLEFELSLSYPNNINFSSVKEIKYLHFLKSDIETFVCLKVFKS